MTVEHATWTAMILLGTVCAAVLLRIAAARRGRDIFLRRIPGLDAFEEALGRATELGRPILFSPGFAELKDMSTYAGLAVLEHTIRLAARYGIRVIVPVPYAPVFSVTKDAVRDAYAAEGRSDLYNPDDVLFLNSDQSAFAAAVTGIMERERVAAAFYFGYYGYESLLLAETGQRIGAVQVAATDGFVQAPFFLAACDYTMFGEELYAASAYLSREPTMLGSLSGQDLAKVGIACLLAAGVFAALVHSVLTSQGGFNALVGLLGR